VPEGVALAVIGCVEGYSCCDVAAPDLRGWVYGGSLSYPYQGADVPVMTYGVQIGLPVVVFPVDSYWGHYCRDRPWYHDAARWANHPPPGHGGSPPQVQSQARPQPQAGPQGGKAVLMRWMHRRRMVAALHQRSVAAKHAVEQHAATMNTKTVLTTIRLV
jgi:hypothetical protein